MNELFDIPKEKVNKTPKKRQMSEFTKFKHDLYKQYCINMKQFGKESQKYRAWLKSVNEVKLNNK